MKGTPQMKWKMICIILQVQISSHVLYLMKYYKVNELYNTGSNV